ncbi:MAG: NAD(P)H-dependent oxidoreductase [Thermoanaerobaculia bacterium]
MARPPGILRIWHGRTPRERADDYAAFLLRRAVPDYRSIPGNLDVRIVRRDEDAVTHFLTLTRWANEAATRDFAGDDPLVARYYPEDADFLLELEPHVVQYELVESEPLLPLPQHSPGDGIVLLGLCGSLRRSSTNRALLEAGVRLAGSLASDIPIRLELFDGISRMPQFSPDAEGETNSVVIELREAVRSADGLLISSPEYARGVPGALKNALDWLVGGEEFVAKPFALWSASARAVRAQEALVETMQTMSGLFVADASLTLALLGKNVTASDLLADDSTVEALSEALAGYAAAFRSR